MAQGGRCRYSHEHKPETPSSNEEAADLFGCCSSLNEGVEGGYRCGSMLSPVCCPTHFATFASEGTALIVSPFLSFLHRFVQDLRRTISA